MNIKWGFILTFLAGFSTLIGTFLIFVKRSSNIIIRSLSFASGVMICVSFFDLIPNSFILLNRSFYLFPSIIFLLIFFVLGVIISMSIDRYMNGEGDLYKVGVISMFSIILHNIPEGIMTFISTTNDFKLGLSLSIAIMLHNIPEGISIGIPIYYSTKSRGKAFFYTLVSGLSEPFGACISYLFFRNINSVILGFILAVTAGIMIQISFYELLPMSFSYKNNRLSILYFFVGFIFMCLIHFILK